MWTFVDQVFPFQTIHTYHYIVWGNRKGVNSVLPNFIFNFSFKVTYKYQNISISLVIFYKITDDWWFISVTKYKQKEIRKSNVFGLYFRQKTFDFLDLKRGHVKMPIPKSKPQKKLLIKSVLGVIFRLPDNIDSVGPYCLELTFFFSFFLSFVLQEQCWRKRCITK